MAAFLLRTWGAFSESIRYLSRVSDRLNRERRMAAISAGCGDRQVDNDAFHGELEALGAVEVRARLATKVYVGAEAALATAWLERRCEASSSEQLDIARSAKDAAWAAARAADTANSKATIAIVIGAISLIVAIVLGVILLLPKHWFGKAPPRDGFDWRERDGDVGHGVPSHCSNDFGTGNAALNSRSRTLINTGRDPTQPSKWFSVSSMNHAWQAHLSPDATGGRYRGQQ
jgi:hypothetical protein